ncbi:hypothetical protein RND81_14G127500 [Saponaria officinalis]|uniref:BAG domain-containing protein n=1 Tax=Saponaria officinalis TaxID=3572 RepID=A0AAW1GP36_SAPOF
MSYRKLEIIHQNPFNVSPFFPTNDLIHPFEFDPFFSGIDLLQIEETAPLFPYAQKRFITRVTRRVNSTESYLKSISDRVDSLESRFDRLLAVKEREEREKKKKLLREADRKYSWTAEIEGAEKKKYTWTAEIEGDSEKKGKRGERKYTWKAEIKGRNDGDDKKTYTWKATIGGDAKEKKSKKEKKSEKSACTARIVEIEEPLVVDDHRSLVLRQAFAKRPGQKKGKKKEISPLDAAVLIQRSFRAYLIRRSQALRALRELAIAKTKLKELRALFHNFSFRSRVSRDAEERQKFSEKLIVLLLTVDAIQGVDMMVRAAKRSMVDELEAMLDVVDPQQPGRSLSMRRTFDMPSGAIQKEIAEGVAQVVQMLDEEHATFEACV